VSLPTPCLLGARELAVSGRGCAPAVSVTERLRRIARHHGLLSQQKVFLPHSWNHSTWWKRQSRAGEASAPGTAWGCPAVNHPKGCAATAKPGGCKGISARPQETRVCHGFEHEVASFTDCRAVTLEQAALLSPGLDLAEATIPCESWDLRHVHSAERERSHQGLAPNTHLVQGDP